MTTEADLLAAIRERPDDDTPKLVLADWLEQNDGMTRCPTCADERFPGYMGSCSLADAFAIEMAERTCKQCLGEAEVPNGFAARALDLRLGVAVRAIVAAPEDDGPRLAYAELCEQGGRADRGEFIRVQCELGKTPKTLPPGQVLYSAGGVAVGLSTSPMPNPAHGVLKEREQELFRQSEETRGWFGCAWPLTQAGAGWAGYLNWFVRGFLGRVECPAADWLTHAAAVLAAHPVRRVRLTTVPEVEFGPEDSQCIDTIRADGMITFLSAWDTDCGGHRQRFGGKTVVTAEAVALGGPDEFGRQRAKHEEHLRFARTPLGYLRCRWPKVEFELPRPAPDYRAFSQDLDDRILRSLGIPPHLASPHVPPGPIVVSGADFS